MSWNLFSEASSVNESWQYNHYQCRKWYNLLPADEVIVVKVKTPLRFN
jgi:hypothetical protein